jgi:DNA repair exonuclease SbcCD ATPase subunit
MLKGQIAIANNISGNVSSNEKLLNHEYLYNRNLEKAHAIEAIDGLEDRLKKIEASNETMAATVEYKEIAAMDRVSSESKRAKKVEEKLDSQIKQINKDILTIEDSQKDKIASLYKVVAEEASARLNNEKLLKTSLETMHNEVTEAQNTANNYAVVASKNIESLNLRLKKDENLFNLHTESFNQQVNRIDELTESFNKHIEDFEAFIEDILSKNISKTELAELSDNFDSKIQALMAEHLIYASELTTIKSSLAEGLEALKSGYILYTDTKYNEALDVAESRNVALKELINSNIEQTANNLQHNIQQLEINLGTLNTSIQNIQQLIESLETEDTNIRDSFNLRFEAFENSIAGMNESLENFKLDYLSKVTALTDEITELHDELTELSLRVTSDADELNLKQAELEANLTNVSENQDRIETELSNKVNQLELSTAENFKTTNKKITDEINGIKNIDLVNLKNSYENADAALTSQITQLTNDFNTNKDSVSNDIKVIQEELQSEQTNRETQIDKVYTDFQNADQVLESTVTEKLNENTTKLDSALVTLKGLQHKIEKVSNVVDFIGITTTDIAVAPETKNIELNGKIYTAQTGNLVLYGQTEFVWADNHWEELGNVTDITTLITELNDRLDIDLETTKQELATANEKIKKLTEYVEDLKTNWLNCPTTLIFDSIEKARGFIAEASLKPGQTYSGMNIFVETSDSFETYILTSDNILSPLMSFSKN